LLALVIVLFAIERYARQSRSYVGIDRSSRPAPRAMLKGARAAWAFAACAVPILIGFIIPAASLINEVASRGLLGNADPTVFRHAVTTLRYAAFATIIAIALGFGAAVAARGIRGQFLKSCTNILAIGYALPGTVLALGLLSPLVSIDEAINWVTSATVGKTVGLVIAGSGGAVIAAYVLRFLAITVGFGQAGLGRIATDLDEAARIAGARPIQVLRTIQWPLLKPAVGGAALLVFVDCLKELPATLLLRPLNAETLSTYIYQFATRGNFEEGALAALMIVAAGMIPALWLAHFGGGGSRSAARQ
jgi:iron(III) transport system permease protein